MFPLISFLFSCIGESSEKKEAPPSKTTPEKRKESSPPDLCKTMWDNDVYFDADPKGEEVLNPEPNNTTLEEKYLSACRESTTALNKAAMTSQVPIGWSSEKVKQIASYAKSKNKQVIAVGLNSGGTHGPYQFLDVVGDRFYIGLASTLQLSAGALTRKLDLYNQSSDHAMMSEFITGQTIELLGYEPIPSTKFKAVQGTDPLELLDDLLKNPPQIMAFGEYHGSAEYDGLSASKIFSNTLLPKMKEVGYSDLVLEFLPHDISNDELKTIWKDGSIDLSEASKLRQYLSVISPEGQKSILLILRQCFSLGITVHGGGPSYEEISSSHTDMVFLIKDISQRQIEGLVNQGKKVLSYGGTNHNNLSGIPEQAFGKVLDTKFSYTEVDIIVPHSLFDLFRVRGKTNITQLDALKIYENYISSSGKINFVTRQKGSYALVYPMEN